MYFVGTRLAIKDEVDNPNACLATIIKIINRNEFILTLDIKSPSEYTFTREDLDALCVIVDQPTRITKLLYLPKK